MPGMNTAIESVVPNYQQANFFPQVYNSPFENHPYKADKVSTTTSLIDPSGDAKCGAVSGGQVFTCEKGTCCSQHGFCGTTSNHCGLMCQPLYGSCGSVNESPPLPSSTNITVKPSYSDINTTDSNEIFGVSQPGNDDQETTFTQTSSAFTASTSETARISTMHTIGTVKKSPAPTATSETKTVRGNQPDGKKRTATQQLPSTPADSSKKSSSHLHDVHFLLIAIAFIGCYAFK